MRTRLIQFLFAFLFVTSAAVDEAHTQEQPLDLDKLWREQRRAVVALKAVGRDKNGKAKVVP
jgi:hypothetical protein